MILAAKNLFQQQEEKRIHEIERQKREILIQQQIANTQYHWKEVFDPDTQQTYFWNELTGEISYEQQQELS